MAHQADNTLISNTEMLLELITTPFRAIGRGLIALAEAGPKMAQLRKLNKMSDADLTAKGLTRDNEALRIVGGC